MKLVKLIICLFAVALVACEQDPLKDYSSNVQNALPPGNEKPKPEPGEIVIEPISALTFTEGEETTVQISYRTVGIDAPTVALIEALPEGASFNSDTNELTWTPAVGTVGSKAILIVPMQLVVKTTEEPFIRAAERINFAVIRNSKVFPEVTLPSSISELTEDSYTNFQIMVRDIYSDKDNPPRLHSFRSNSKDLSVFARFSDNPTQDANDPKLWKFSVFMDLDSAELTASQSNINFSAYAISSVSGASSEVAAMSVSVLTKLADPLFSWPDGQTYEVQMGQKKSITFTLIAPKNNGGVTEGRIDSLAFESSCGQIKAVENCTCSIKTPTIGFCRLDLHPTAAGESIFTLKVVGSLKGHSYKVAPKDFNFKIPVQVNP